MDHKKSFSIHEIPAAGLEAELKAFGTLLHACVHAGSSIGFILPFSPTEAEAFWREKILPTAKANLRLILAAYVDGMLAGTGQLDLDRMPNQPHRAEVSKLMVHPDFRRRGIAKGLMMELEEKAQALGKTLLTLDTRTGDNAELLYLSLGYTVVGQIPDFAIDSHSDRLDATTLMYKKL